MHMVSCYFARLVARELRLDSKHWPRFLEGTQQSQLSIEKQNRMPLVDFNRLLSNALAMSGDTGLGLRFGHYADVLALGEGGFVALAAPDLQRCLHAFADFSRLSADYMTLDIQVGTHLRFQGREHPGLGADLRRTQHEVLVLMLQNTIERVLGRPFVEGRYHFAYPQPEHAQRYGSVFHSPWVFNSVQTGVDIPRKLGRAPSPFHDQAQWRLGLDRCAALMRELSGKKRQLYGHHVLGILRSQQVELSSIDWVAEFLNLSSRTLNRRLAGEGLRFRELHNQVRQEWAHHYLTETDLSVEAIGAQLGYQDSANFRRAFKRLNRCTPQEYRRQMGR